MKPLGNKIQLDIKEVKIGMIQSDSIEEHGTIIDWGEEVENQKVMRNHQLLEKGKTLYFKAWAVDVITEGQDKYYFISCDSDAICAISD